MSSEPHIPSENRFTVARATLILDRVMTGVIKFGGWLVMLAVFAIFAFIFLQILPLFGRPSVEPVGQVAVPVENVAVMGVDEWGELPFFLTRAGKLYLADLPRDLETRTYEREKSGSEGESDRLAPGPRGLFEVDTGLPDKNWTAFYYDAYQSQVALGSEDGRIALLNIDYRTEFLPDRSRRVVADVKSELLPPLSISEAPIREIAFFDSSANRSIAFLQEVEGQTKVTLQTYTVQSSLFGAATMVADKQISLDTDITDENPERLLIGGRGDRIFLSTEGGWLYYLRLQDERLERVQKLRPFAGKSDPSIFSVNWLLGKQSLILTSESGANVTLASYLDQEAGQILYTRIKDFSQLEAGGAADFSAAQRNRGFLLANEQQLSLRYSTTKDVRWEKTTDYRPQKIALGPRWDSIFAYDTEQNLHVYALDDPHPNAGWKAFFGKIWYEGKSDPEFEWQSSSGTSDFEPKLSIVPLFFGSIKGTLYAMLFAMPIAVLAAIYVSQYLRPEAKRYIKPAMEIMASLPSVVLGFLAALWLAPLIEDRVPSILLMLITIPLSAALLGYFWGRLPQTIRNSIRPGSEWLVIIPVILVVGYLAWQLGPALEALVFRVYDPDIGAKVGNFRQWWVETTGVSFEQRNSLVVGLMMGFAVIPIIFTISEDALTNVPPYLTSASLALGASRWQTTWRVILPTASPGIFSATIIGFGRAVGETMILLMATGNTPIMEWNIFNGMRTLAANIAVELPEAPQFSTLYRTLFLGAMALFLLTFFLNTVAEITRQHLREKYKTI
ncbi:MAG: ABC transporter permease subunit [Verrucomicrobia bacterium]|nr:ABC transporter permease subunit [Verrucomicrobiota bacterium]